MTYQDDRTYNTFLRAVNNYLDHQSRGYVPQEVRRKLIEAGHHLLTVSRDCETQSGFKGENLTTPHDKF